MVTPQDARATMLAALPPRRPVETVALEAALGRVLAEDVSALRDQPPFAGSAMDGYALRASDTPGRLQVVGEAAAGRGFAGVLQAGQAVRIFTGAPMPEGANSVLIQEDAGREGDDLVAPAVSSGRNVRARGIDFHATDMLLRKGTMLDGVALSLAAAGGAALLKVAKPPRVAVLATGDEIVAPGCEPAPHQIYESGSFGLAGLIRAWGGEARRITPQGDDTAAIARTVEAALSDADLLVTIGGASVGDHDLVRPALAALDASFAVTKIAIRPGKPTFFAETRLGPVLGLPGNPASGLVCAFLFLKPLVDAWLGREQVALFAIAQLSAPLPKNGPREHYLRAATTRDGAVLTVRAAEDQDSSLISVFQGANALIRRMPDDPAANAGDLVEIVDLRRA